MCIRDSVDTVEMKGDGFESKVKLGSKVTKGQLLLTMDLDKIKAAAVSYTHLDVYKRQIQYYLRFLLSICSTSLAVSVLRIMRYCHRNQRITMCGQAAAGRLSTGGAAAAEGARAGRPRRI